MVFSVILASLLAGSAPEPPELRLWRLYERRDFFSLQRDLPAPMPGDSSRIRFVRAQTDSAFGQYEASSRILRDLLQSKISNASLDAGARERLMLNERAMFHYRAALSAIAPVMHDRGLGNRAALLLQLQDVAPEILHPSARSTKLSLDRFGATEAEVDGVSLRMGIDTGANWSVLSRSAARAAGLRIRPAAYRVRIASGKAVEADIVVSELRLGSALRISNVVFLVLPDSALRISPLRTLDGLIGLPELSEFGSIRFGADNTIVLNGVRPAAAAVEPVALIEGDPVVQATRGTERIACRIDTGSNRTVFYRSSRKQTHAVLGIAGHKIRIQHPITLPRTAGNQPFVNCSLGRDALRQIEPYTLDLRNMRLGLN